MSRPTIGKESAGTATGVPTTPGVDVLVGVFVATPAGVFVGVGVGVDVGVAVAATAAHSPRPV